jgi:DNA modification methylase
MCDTPSGSTSGPANGSFSTAHRVLLRAAEDLSGIGDATVDLVVTSPPYPMIEMWDEVFAAQDSRIKAALEDGDGLRAFDHMHELLTRVWRECSRVLKPGAMACINVGDATRSLQGHFRLYANHSRIIEQCVDLGFESLPVILWRKQTNAPNKFMGSGMLPGGAYVTLEHEYILVFRKGHKRKYGDEDRRRRRESAYFWEERNRWFSDLWDFKGVRQLLAGPGRDSRRKQLRERSAAFPFELAYRLINMYSMRGDLVLDPFLGTGTTTAAAVTAARNSMGVEIDEAFREEVFLSVASAAARMNARVWDRIAGHLDFVEHRTADGAGALEHFNVPHGFPVMTGQETELTLSYVSEIHRDDSESFTAFHRDVGPVTADTASPPPPMLWGFPQEA